MTDETYFTYADDHAELEQLRARVKELEGVISVAYGYLVTDCPTWAEGVLENEIKGNPNAQT